MEKESLTVNQFLKNMTWVFKNAEYRATSKEGVVFKSIGWDVAVKKLEDSNRKYKHF